MMFSFDIKGYTEKLNSYKDGVIEYKTNCPLSSLTTFKIGGPCAVAVFCRTIDEIKFASDSAREMEKGIKIIGRGSNLLCSDEGYDGAVVVTDGVSRVLVEGDTIECECGVSLTAAANEALDAGLEGAEFMYGIPGSIGGGVYMNAGAYGGQLSDIITEVKVLDMSSGEIFALSCDRLDFSYRHSLFMDHPEYAVLGVKMKLKKGDKNKIREKMRDLIARRRDKQPLEFPSAGSTFKRCEGRFTAQLIDEAGLKGFTVGGAQVSEKHAGFVINRGGATCSDVMKIIEKVKEELFRLHGIRIECEVEYLG